VIQLIAPLLILAQEEGGVAEEPSGIDLLIPEQSELIAGLLAFVIIFVFVWKWVLPAANRAMEARQQAITGELQAAEQSKHEAESLLDDYKKQVAGARDEANSIVEEARQTAESLRAEMIARAEAEAAEITRKAREEASAERDRASSAIRDEVASLSLAVAQKAVGDAVDAKAQKTLVDRYIAELETLGG
jgi:F-type H+-transporting ATPase subunit b